MAGNVLESRGAARPASEDTMAEKTSSTPMSQEAAARIQSATDRRGGGGDGFKERAAAAATRNTSKPTKSTK